MHQRDRYRLRPCAYKINSGFIGGDFAQEILQAPGGLL